MTKTVKLELLRSHDLAAWIECEMRDFEVPASLRNRCSGACLVISQEHHQAIIFLLSQLRPIHASAFGLVRSVYESLVRGLWLNHCATDEQIQAFSTGTVPPKMPTLLEALKKTPEYASGQLTAIYKNSWNDMCSYAHTGSHQVQRWNTSGAIEPNYLDDEVIEIMGATGALALLSLNGVATISSNIELAIRVLEKSTKWAQ